MTRWFAYFKDKSKSSYFRLVIAQDLPTAEMLAGELAARSKGKCIGIIVAPQSFQ